MSTILHVDKNSQLHTISKNIAQEQTDKTALELSNAQNIQQPEILPNEKCVQNVENVKNLENSDQKKRIDKLELISDKIKQTKSVVTKNENLGIELATSKNSKTVKPVTSAKPPKPNEATQNWLTASFQQTSDKSCTDFSWSEDPVFQHQRSNQTLSDISNLSTKIKLCSGNHKSQVSAKYFEFLANKQQKLIGLPPLISNPASLTVKHSLTATNNMPQINPQNSVGSTKQPIRHHEIQVQIPEKQLSNLSVFGTGNTGQNQPISNLKTDKISKPRNQSLIIKDVKKSRKLSEKKVDFDMPETDLEAQCLLGFDDDENVNCTVCLEG